MKKYLLFPAVLLPVILVFLISACSIFLPYTVTIDIEPIEGGTVQILPDERRFREGDAVTVSAVPNEGYFFAGWEGDVQDISSRVELVMDSDKYLTARFTPAEPRSWTIMLYLDGDNNLESEALADFNNIEGGLANSEYYGRGFVDNAYVIALVDRSAMADDGNYVSTPTEQGGADWTDARLYCMLPDGDNQYFGSERMDDGFTDGYGHLEELGEMNMADPATLSWFIAYCRSRFPSGKYALVLWNHGGGVRSARSLTYTPLPTSSLKEICVDEDNGGGHLILDDVQTALGNNFSASDKLSFLGMDACLMGGVEVAYEFRDLAEYMAFSPASEYGGWGYTRIFETLTAGAGPEQLATLVVEAFRDKANAYDLQMNTQTAVNLANITALQNALNQLASALDAASDQTTIEGIRDASTHYYDGTSEVESVTWPYLEIGDFCSRLESASIAQSQAGNVKTALSSCISYAWAGTDMGAYEGSGISHGLSLFFSRGERSYNGESHYYWQWWYYDQLVQASGGDFYGGIDFAYSNSNGTVETWRELMEKWYDPSNTLTPGTF